MAPRSRAPSSEGKAAARKAHSRSSIHKHTARTAHTGMLGNQTFSPHHRSEQNLQVRATGTPRPTFLFLKGPWPKPHPKPNPKVQKGKIIPLNEVDSAQLALMNVTLLTPRSPHVPVPPSQPVHTVDMANPAPPATPVASQLAGCMPDSLMRNTAELAKGNEQRDQQQQQQQQQLQQHQFPTSKDQQVAEADAAM
eukprot:6181562-Pleurochrysis_carterae.AAC.2